MPLDFEKERFYALAEIIAVRKPKADIESVAIECELSGINIKKIGPDWYVLAEDLLLAYGVVDRHREQISLPKLAKSLVGLAAVVALIISLNYFSTSAFGRDFKTGLATVEQAAAVSQIFLEKIKAIDQKVENFPSQVGQAIKNFFGRSRAAWVNFFLSEEERNEILKQQIKAEIQAEIEQELERVFGQIFAAGQTSLPTNKPSGGEGTVIVPSSGEAGVDASLKEQIRQGLSDDVVIEFDQSGRAGTIRPLIPGVNQNYLFIMTPIKPK